jgi:hypothetical protein
MKKHLLFYVAVTGLMLWVACSAHKKEELAPLDSSCLVESRNNLKMLLDTATFGSTSGTYPLESSAILEAAIDNIELGIALDKASQFILQFEVDNYCSAAAEAMRSFYNTVNEGLTTGDPGELYVYGKGTGTHIDFGTHPEYNFAGGAFTVETWLKFDEVSYVSGAMPTILATFHIVSDGDYYGWSANFQSGSIVRMSVACTDGLHEPGGVWPTKEDDWKIWHHYAAAYDGATVKVYVNGELKAERSAGSMKSSQWHNLWAFGDPQVGDANRQLSGAIKKLRLWNGAKTQVEIAALMQTDVTGNESDLLCAWDFTTVLDDDQNMPSVKDGSKYTAKMVGTSYRWRKPR